MQKPNLRAYLATLKPLSILGPQSHRAVAPHMGVWAALFAPVSTRLFPGRILPTLALPRPPSCELLVLQASALGGPSAWDPLP